jgi:hypothetical protein
MTCVQQRVRLREAMKHSSYTAGFFHFTLLASAAPAAAAAKPLLAFIEPAGLVIAVQTFDKPSCLYAAVTAAAHLAYV